MNFFSLNPQAFKNPFATPGMSGGLLGMAQNPAYGLFAGVGNAKPSKDDYAAMAAPYAQWAAQQLQQQLPEQPKQQQMQWGDPQQNALAQMWDQQQQMQRRLDDWFRPIQG